MVHILQYGPEGSIGLDTHPGGDGLMRQDFFEYVSCADHALLEAISRIASIGKPPVEVDGYLNPLAKASSKSMQQLSVI
jgi:hypothetical protein